LAEAKKPLTFDKFFFFNYRRFIAGDFKALVIFFALIVITFTLPTTFVVFCQKSQR
jgi:hypothetical protein